MSELEFPTIDPEAAEPAASTAIAQTPAGELSLETMDLTKLALTGFAESRTAVATAMKTLQGVQHDLSTPTKLIEAKTLRQRLVNAPLATARKVSAGIKSKLTEASKAVGAELGKIEADFAAADALITPQIDAAQEKLDEERRQREAAEAARVQKHRDNLTKLAEPAERCRQPGMTAERIANGIAAVSAIEIDRAAWEEFADRAEEQKAVTLEKMQALHAAAVVAEAEALRLAEERAEQERKAAELAAKEAELAAAAAALAKQQAEFAAAQQAAAAEAQAKADEAARLEREQREESERQARELQEARERSERAEAAQNIPEQGSQQVLKAEAPEPDATDRDAPASTSPSVGSMGAGQPSDEGPVAEVEEARTLSLGEIKALIAPLSISAEGLEQLGFAAVKVKAACMYRPSDLAAMKAAMREVLA